MVMLKRMMILLTMLVMLPACTNPDDRSRLHNLLSGGGDSTVEDETSYKDNFIQAWDPTIKTVIDDSIFSKDIYPDYMDRTLDTLSEDGKEIMRNYAYDSRIDPEVSLKEWWEAKKIPKPLGRKLITWDDYRYISIRRNICEREPTSTECDTAKVEVRDFEDILYAEYEYFKDPTVFPESAPEESKSIVVTKNSSDTPPVITQADPDFHVDSAYYWAWTLLHQAAHTIGCLDIFPTIPPGPECEYSPAPQIEEDDDVIRLQEPDYMKDHNWDKNSIVRMRRVQIVAPTLAPSSWYAYMCKSIGAPDSSPNEIYTRDSDTHQWYVTGYLTEKCTVGTNSRLNKVDVPWYFEKYGYSHASVGAAKRLNPDVIPHVRSASSSGGFDKVYKYGSQEIDVRGVVGFHDTRAQGGYGPGFYYPPTIWAPPASDKRGDDCQFLGWTFGHYGGLLYWLAPSFSPNNVPTMAYWWRPKSNKYPYKAGCVMRLP